MVKHVVLVSYHMFLYDCTTNNIAGVVGFFLFISIGSETGVRREDTGFKKIGTTKVKIHIRFRCCQGSTTKHKLI